MPVVLLRGALLITIGMACIRGAIAQIATDGTLGPAGSLTGPNYAIGANLGRQVGSNLFHSFSTFNVATGESATFSGPNGISNVLGRVTGGSASNIDGVLRSTMAGANLFLINPKGILFGPNASLDLTGSFHATTANYVKLADGGRFDASDPGASVLTSAPPAAFGFLGTPAPITVQGSALNTSQGASVAFVGGQLKVTDANIGTVAGDLRLVATGGAGEVPLDATGSSLKGATLASVTIERSSLNTSGGNETAPGRILIRGGQITVTESTLSSANHSNAVASPIELAASGDLGLSSSHVASSTYGIGRGADLSMSGSNIRIAHNSQVSSMTTGAGHGGDVVLNATNALNVEAAQQDAGYTNIYSDTFGAGRGGDVRLSGDSVTVQSGNVYTYSGGPGAGGSIVLSGRDVAITDGAWVYTWSDWGTSGDTGAIAITGANRFLIGGLDWFGNQAFLFTDTQGDGRAGDVRIAAPTIDVIGGRIQSFSYGAGSTGSLNFSGDTVRIHGGNGSFGMVDTTVTGYSSGSGGDINVNASEVFEISRGDTPDQWTRVSTSTFSSGHAGSINVNAGSIRVLDGDQAIWAGSGGIGNAGSVNLNADEIVIAGGARILAINWGEGRGGDVTLRAPSVLLSGGSVHVETQGPANAGNIVIEGETVRIAGNAGLGSGIASFVNHWASGRGGDITIRASHSFELDGTQGLSSIHSETRYLSTGDGGNVMVEAPLVRLTGPSTIYLPANGSGNGGNVLIRAHDIELGAGTSIASDNPPWGTGRGGNITIEGTGRLSLAMTGPVAPFEHWHLLPFSAQIIAWTAGPGSAGNVTISIPEIVAGLGSQFTSYTFGSGDAGTITFNADRVRLTDASHILTYTESGTGNAGNIVLNIGERLEMTGANVVVQGFFGGLSTVRRLGIDSSSAGTGNAGSVFIRAPVILLDDARIQTSTRQSGRGGSVEIHAGELTMLNGAQVDAKALPGSSGDAGPITINVAKRFEIAGISPIDGAFSGVNAETLGSGRGGNVSLAAGSLVIDRGFVRSSTGGAGDAGSIWVDAAEVLVANGGFIDAGTASGSSGAGGSVSIQTTGAITVSGIDSNPITPVSVVYEDPIFRDFYTPGRPQGANASTISSNTAGSGLGGNVTLSASRITIADGGHVSANSSGSGPAGNIFISAPDWLRLYDGSITTQAISSDGGNIDIRAGNMVRLQNSEISTSVGSGEGSGGNLFIDPTFVILENSRISANAFGGSGGNIHIITDYFMATPDSVIDASSQLGLSGSVQIAAPRTEPAANLPRLPATFLDASSLLRDACAAHVGQRASSLVGVGRGGVAAAPDGYSGSRYFADTAYAMPLATGTDTIGPGPGLPASKPTVLSSMCGR
jgi:filamentous hemagglutinin family protein